MLDHLTPLVWCLCVVLAYCKSISSYYIKLYEAQSGRNYLHSSFTKCSIIQTERKKVLGTLKYGHHRCCVVTCIDSVDTGIYKKMSMDPVKIIKPDP